MRVLDLATSSEKFARLVAAESALAVPPTNRSLKQVKLQARSLLEKILPPEICEELAAFVTCAGKPAAASGTASAKRRKVDERTAPAAILLQNLVPSFVNFPPTPNQEGRKRVSLDSLSAQWLLGIGALDPRFLATDIVPSDVVPRPGKEHVLGNEGSVAFLGWHRDGQFNRDGLIAEQHLPAVLSLFCIRADHERVAVTGVCSTANAIEAVSEADRKLLREEPLLWELTQVAEGKGCDEGSSGLPLVVGDGDDVTIRMLEFKPQGSEAALRAHGRLLEAVEAQQWPVKLQPGDLILVDNYRALHSRSSFEPRFDGDDRWLQRLSW